MLTYADILDTDAGTHIRGASLGGFRAQALALGWDDEFHWQRITVLRLMSTTTDLTNTTVNEYQPRDIEKMAGYDLANVDFATQAAANRLNEQYWFWTISNNDTHVFIDVDQAVADCNRFKVKCRILLHPNGHSFPSLAQIPEHSPFRALYSGPDEAHRLNLPVIVFTNSSADTASNKAQYGHYGYGWTYNAAGIVDDADRVSVPIQYRQLTDAGPMPDMDAVATGDYTVRPRHFPVIKGQVYDWSLGANSGAVTALEDGEVTVPQITLASGEPYADMVITRGEAPTPIVYTRQPRNSTAYSDESGSVEEAANWQRIPDIGNPWTNSESDVVMDNILGEIRVIHDCTNSSQICAAQEAKVSPDSLRIIYTVSTSPTDYQVKVWGGPWTDMREFLSTEAQLWLYDIPSGTRRMLSSGHHDRGADWLSNSKIVFASDRGGTVSARAHDGVLYAGKAFQIHTAVITPAGLSQLRNIGPHDNFTMNPAVLTDGTILYSCFWGTGPRGITHTAANQWGICSMDSNGANGAVVAGMHGSPNLKTYELIKDFVDPLRRGEGSTELKGLRPVAEIFKDYLMLTSYYRGNSVGPNGIIIGMKRSNAEGVLTTTDHPGTTYHSPVIGSGRFIPGTLQVLTPWANDQDAEPKFGKDGLAWGRSGQASPYDGVNWMYTHSIGDCYFARDPAKATRAWVGGQPTCKKRIDKALARVITNPLDTAQTITLACESEKWNCWDARPITTYQKLFGQPRPVLTPPLQGSECYLQVVDIGQSELYEVPGNWTPEQRAQNKITFMGNADHPELINTLDVTPFEHWASYPTRQGYKSYSPVLSVKAESDGSVRMQVPCETPLLIAGHGTAGGRATDLLTHSLRAGETRTCHGCHDGHSESRLGMLAPSTERFMQTIAGQKSP